MSTHAVTLRAVIRRVSFLGGVFDERVALAAGDAGLEGVEAGDVGCREGVADLRAPLGRGGFVLD